MSGPAATPWRDDGRDDGRVQLLPGSDAARNDTGWRRRRCPVCTREFHSVGRQVYDQPACKQRAFRRRQSASLTPQVDPTARLDWVAHSLYACPECGEETLGERRCPDCNLMGRNVGLAVRCPNCDEVLRLDDLLAELGLRLADPISRPRPRRSTGGMPLA